MTSSTNSYNAAISLDPKHPLRLLNLCPQYAPTPLNTISLSGDLTSFVKDESGRLGTSSFKALGGAYAVIRFVEDFWIDNGGSYLDSGSLDNRLFRTLTKDMTFVCASAGNHGLAVAAGARLVGANAQIHLPESVPSVFSDRLARLGANVIRSGKTYEEAVYSAIDEAKRTSSILLPDISSDSDWSMPLLVMEGYTVLTKELCDQFHAQNVWPTAVYIQAGVGGLAAAMAFNIRRSWPVQPKIVVVEPTAAPCVQQSINSGRSIEVKGPPSIMARLDCKRPSDIAITILSDLDVAFTVVTDQQSEAACQTLNQYGISSTPSGAAGLAAILNDSQQGCFSLSDIPLFVVTEGSLSPFRQA